MKLLLPTNRSAIHALLAFALMLRVAVPSGFMAASVEDGWYLKLCPDGMPVQVMEALFGHHHAHHDNAQEPQFTQCALAALSCDALTSLISDFTWGADERSSVWRIEQWTVQSDSWLGFRSRAPPHST